MVRLAALTLAFAVFAAAGVHAQEREAYKYVDEKGNVTYSQTPPVIGKDANKIDISPANSARGGAAHLPYSGSRSYTVYADDRHRNDAGSRERARQEAERRRLADLEAECMRARGADCKNPETLRYLEAQKIPRAGKP